MLLGKVVMWQSSWHAAAGDNKSRAEQRTGGTQQINGGIAELSGHQAGRRTRQSVSDVQEGNEATHCAAAIGWQYALECFDAESGENQRASEACDEGPAQRHQLIGRAP